MEQLEDTGIATDLDPGIGVGEIVDNLQFIFISHGVVLFIIVVIGVVLNFLCLAVLCRKCFRSSPPYCLLQALTLGDLAILFLSIYSDIHPAIAAHRKVQAATLPGGKLLRRLEAILDHPDPLGINAPHNGTASNQLHVTPAVGRQDLELFLKSLLGPDEEFELTRLPARAVSATKESAGWNSPSRRTTVNDSSRPRRETTRHSGVDGGASGESVTEAQPLGNKTSGIEINTEPLRKAVERFVAYFLMTYSLLIVTTLAIERCFAVLRPMRARVLITVRRTRCAIFIITFACFVIHCPQLVREVTLVFVDPARVRDDFRGKLIQSFRHDYETFLMYLTSSLLVVVLAANFVLVVAVARQRRKVSHSLRETVPSSDDKNQNVNVANVIIFLTFCQLPQNIAGNVVTHLAMASFKRHVSSFIKTVVVVRVLYVSNSALNCLVYCLFAKRFRQAFLDTYFRFCGTRDTTDRRANGCVSSPETSHRSRFITQPSPTASHAV